MKESSSWSTLRGHLKARGAHLQRFEDKLTGGIPDTNVCLRGSEFWLEGKALREWPKRETTLVKVGLRPDQALWLDNRVRAGGHAFVWIKTPTVWILSTRFFDLRDGITRADLLTEPVFMTAAGLVDYLEGRLV
jgi:hypothetical protein